MTDQIPYTPPHLIAIARQVWRAFDRFNTSAWVVTPRLKRTPCYQAGCDDGWLRATDYWELCRCSLYVIYPRGTDD